MNEKSSSSSSISFSSSSSYFYLFVVIIEIKLGEEDKWEKKVKMWEEEGMQRCRDERENENIWRCLMLICRIDVAFFQTNK